MSATELLQRLERAEAALRGDLSGFAARAGADLCAEIADRVINTGERADGQKFTPYSTKPVPAWWYYGRSLNAGGEQRVRAAAKAKRGVSYRDFRGFNNRPTAFKNFSFSNEMWRGFGLKKVEAGNGKYTITIGGRTPVSAERIAKMEALEGRSIIEPSAAEVQRVADALRNEVIKTMRG